MTTNYNKTDELSPTTRKLTGHKSRKTQSPRSFRPPYPPTYTLPTLKLLNEETTSDIQKHKQNLWKAHLDAHWDHRHNTHILWKTIHGLSNRASPPTLNTSITFSNKIATTPKHIANCFTKQFTNTVKHATTRQTDTPPSNRATHKIQGYNITLTTNQFQEAIKESKNNNSQCPDKLNIRHLKHLCPLRLLMSMLKTALNCNIIPHIWKLANIVPIPKPNKDIDKGTSYMPISLLSVIAKILKKSLLPYITANIPNPPMQHGYKTQYSTHIKQHRCKGVQPNGSLCANNHCSTRYEQSFRHNRPNGSPCANNHCSTRYEQSFRHNKHTNTLIRKLLQTKIRGTSSSQTTSRDENPTQHTTITHSHNVNSKLAFHKVASFHQQYLSFTLYTYHHTKHRFRSWSMQITSPSHLHIQAAKKCIQPYIQKGFAWTKYGH